MSSVVRVVWYAFVLVTTLSCSRTPAPELTDIGPRVVSNQTSQPLALVGRNFVPGMQLTIGDPFSRTLPVTTIDATHAYTRLPRDLTFQPASDAAAVRVSLVGQTAHPVLLRIVNDAAFPDITMLVATGSTLFAASSTTDKLYRIPMDTLRPTALDAGDGPSALAVIADGDGTPRLAIAHAWEPTIWICDATTGVKLRVIPAPAYASALTADGDALVVAEQARDTVRRIAIADGTEVWRRAVDPNPKSLSMTDEAVAVGSALTGRVELLDKHTGEPRAVIAPTPATRIVGGHTEAFARYIMGGKGERALAFRALHHGWQR